MRLFHSRLSSGLRRRTLTPFPAPFSCSTFSAAKNNLLEMRLGLKPVVSADRKAVRLQFATVAPKAVLDFSKLPAVVFDVGQSLLVDITDVFPLGPTVGVPISNQLGGQLTEGVITSGGLLNAADHDRLFKNAGPTGRTLLLITGDVLIAEEEEAQSPAL